VLNVLIQCTDLIHLQKNIYGSDPSWPANTQEKNYANAFFSAGAQKKTLRITEGFSLIIKYTFNQ
jgi:hypothetical protein